MHVEESITYNVDIHVICKVKWIVPHLQVMHRLRRGLLHEERDHGCERIISHSVGGLQVCPKLKSI